MNASKAPTPSAGRAIGSATRQNAPHGVQPSKRAAAMRLQDCWAKFARASMYT